MWINLTVEEIDDIGLAADDSDAGEGRRVDAIVALNKRITNSTLPVEAILVISTAHIRDTTDTKLRADDTRLVVYAHGEYGHMISVPSDDDLQYETEEPDDLVACVQHARSLGFHWLLLDRDATMIEDLPTYEW